MTRNYNRPIDPDIVRKGEARIHYPRTTKGEQCSLVFLILQKMQIVNAWTPANYIWPFLYRSEKYLYGQKGKKQVGVLTNFKEISTLFTSKSLLVCLFSRERRCIFHCNFVFFYDTEICNISIIHRRLLLLFMGNAEDLSLEKHGGRANLTVL